MSAKFKTEHIWACTPTTSRGEHAFLSGDPKGKNFLYVNGNNIIIRDIENPNVCDVYIEHQYPTTSARYSPSGYYIASGDNRGNVRIWDTVNTEHILKYTYQPLSGAIKDIAWTEDNKRLVLVGEGNTKFGAAIMWDTGTSVGAIDQINKKANTCDVRQKRPYRAIVGSDDFKVNFYEGVPFKHKAVLHKHSRFVLCTRFSPDGELFLSAGSDGKCFLHDGKTSEFKQALGGDKAHSGGIYGASWSGDSRQILTASGDKTVKVWDVETGKAVTEFVLGKEVGNQQLSCLWQNNNLLTLGLNGDLTYLNPSDPLTPIRVIKGHQKAIKSIAVNTARTKVFSGSFDGATNYWDVSTGYAESVEGQDKPQMLTQLDYSEGKLSTIGPDDTMRTIDANSGQFESGSCGLDSQPRGVARGAGGLTVIAGIEKITVVRDNQKGSVLEVPFTATTVHIHPNMTEVAVGAEDGNIHIYTLSGDKLTEKTTFQGSSDGITKCRFSPDGEYLVAGGAKCVYPFRVQEDYKVLDYSTFKHYSKVTDVAWSPNSKNFASSSLDGAVYIWSVENTEPIIKQKNVHGRVEVSSVQWITEDTIVTGSIDACLRVSSLQL